jgi:serine/threonine-protein kinase RsbW
MSDSHDHTATIPSDTAHAAEVQEQIISLLEHHSYTPRDVFSMRLAIEEAIVNAIKHGNRRDLSKSVHVSWSVCSQRVVVSVEDEGPGFDPSDVPDCTADENLDKPSGRGIMLMKNFLSALEYNEQGNRVTLIKERDGEIEAAEVS